MSEDRQVLTGQAAIDADRARMADGIVAGQSIQTVEEGRLFARNWIVTAAQHAANEEYYRGLLDRIGESLGIEARTADDGSVFDVVFCAKLPELVERLKSRLELAHSREHELGGALRNVLVRCGALEPSTVTAGPDLLTVADAYAASTVGG